MHLFEPDVKLGRHDQIFLKTLIQIFTYTPIFQKHKNKLRLK